ncbi:uncharacterized protein BDW47DRAFT_116046 [Aspergillus candidus]|uniref:Nucleoside phosphorylase domain-containing protein n=1 Tax=Aspergillus candidus TaxID=41067 RepID=A0A2I2FI22_ASPCN|nr:hypothetical protein BDW47DRAFT_116046 [Aspergillus candidus]PLB40262.1 hypothetical protein BDW47DRAFT_116046 [Aspergillus candidus]
MSHGSLSHEDYTVGWICALPVELAAAKVMLDQIHPPLPNAPTDRNTYVLGTISGHNVVVAGLSAGVIGPVSAAVVAEQMVSTFCNIRFGLMVGIGGGIPNSEVDIRLGDVVVSIPTREFGGVVQYDHGKLVDGRTERTGSLNQPPQVLLTAIAQLQADHLIQDSLTAAIISQVLEERPQMRRNFAYPGGEEDRLFHATYKHAQRGESCRDSCDSSLTILRPSRQTEQPTIYYGLIASGNQVIKDSNMRDQIGKDLGAYCVEMEAAGLMNNFPCLIIRGICDYADSHKNDKWQGYAAAVAAAYAKELLSVTSVSQTAASRKAVEILQAELFKIPFDTKGVPMIDEFIGRETEIENIWSIIRPDTEPMRKVAILNGMGGIGKTQLAIHLARVHKGDFTAIFWIDGSNKQTLIRSLETIFSKIPALQYEQASEYSQQSGSRNESQMRAEKVLRWLSIEKNSKWLLIFDNVDEYNPVPIGQDDSGDIYDIEQYFPSADHGSIIITTRLQQLAELGRSCPLLAMHLLESTILLAKSSGYNTEPRTTINDDMEKLASRLEGLPLAIVIAGSYIRCTGISHAKYLQYYEQAWNEMQSARAARPPRQYSNGNLMTTWCISYFEVKKRSSSSARLFFLLSYFYHNDICLIQKNLEINSYSLHPVIQDWCQNELTNIDPTLTDDVQKNKTFVMASLGQTIPDKLTPDYWVQQKRVLPHVNHVRPRLEAYLGDGQHEIILMSIFEFGVLYGNEDDWGCAEMMYRQAFHGLDEIFGPDDIYTLRAMNNLGLSLQHQEKIDEAVEILLQTLKRKERVLGSDDESTLDTVSNLAGLYGVQNKTLEAEMMFRRALETKENILGPTHPSTMQTLQSFASFYGDHDRLAEAKDMTERTVMGFTKELGPEHISTLQARFNLAGVFLKQGNLEAVERELSRARDGFERNLGPGHETTLYATLLLAQNDRCQHKTEKAKLLLTRMTAITEHTSKKAAMIALCLSNDLARMYHNEGDFDRAEELFQSTALEWQRMCGLRDRCTLLALDGLADTYRSKNKICEAEAIWTLIVEGPLCSGATESDTLTHIAPDASPRLHALRSLASVRQEQGRLPEANQILEEALTVALESFEPSDPVSQGIIKDLHAVRCLLGHSEEGNIVTKDEQSHLFRFPVGPYTARLATGCNYVQVPPSHKRTSSELCTSFYMISAPAPDDLAIVQFEITCRSEGQLNDGLEGPRTWFECSVLRPWSEDADFDSLLETVDIKSCPEDFGDDIQEAGWYFENIPVASGGSENRDDGSAEISCTVVTNEASEEKQEHMVIWYRDTDDPNGRRVMPVLQEGDIIVLWARAQYPGWVHHVERARIILFHLPDQPDDW